MHTELLGQRFTLYNNTTIQYTIYTIHICTTHYTLYNNIAYRVRIPLEPQNLFWALFVTAQVTSQLRRSLSLQYCKPLRMSITKPRNYIKSSYSLDYIFTGIRTPVYCSECRDAEPQRRKRRASRLLLSCLSAFVVVPVGFCPCACRLLSSCLSAFVVVPVGFCRCACHPVGFCGCACRL